MTLTQKQIRTRAEYDAREATKAAAKGIILPTPEYDDLEPAPPEPLTFGKLVAGVFLALLLFGILALVVLKMVS
ncbi:MAG: hypothetical protein WA634_11565 [Silvibacterium sp.]